VLQAINANHEQGFLFPLYVSNRVPENHPARFIKEFVDSLSLEDLIKAEEMGIEVLVNIPKQI
jgi:transposase